MNSLKKPWPRIIIGGALLGILIAIHFSILVVTMYPMVAPAVLPLSVLLGIAFSWEKKTLSNVKTFQYKTASGLSYLLPLSLLIYTIATAYQIEAKGGSEYAAGGVIMAGGTFMVMAFVIGVPLGLLFNNLAKEKVK